MRVFECTISNDDVLLIGGPAAVKVIEGEIEVLGWKSQEEKIIVIRKGRFLPIETPSSAKINIKTQSERIMRYAKHRAGMSIWKTTLSKINLEEFKKILIIGETDSGKTTLSTFLANQYLQKGKVMILDSDVGQNDLTPPGYVGMVVLRNHVTDLREVKANSLKYYGDIKPSTDPERLINIIHEMSLSIKDRIIINTDGYVKDEGLNIKKKLIEKIKPDLVISLEVPISVKVKTLILPKVRGIIKTKMDRKERRELQYASFLQKLKYGVNVNFSSIPVCIFGHRIKLRILENKRLGLFICKDGVGSIGNKDLRYMFISLEDDRGKEYIGWIKNVSKNKATILTMEKICDVFIKNLHLGLIRYNGEKEEILKLIYY